MLNRLTDLFAQSKRFKLSLFFTAGYPQLADTNRILTAIEQGGVDFVEIGFPFSDPVADGPVIQNSSQQAIANGMALKVLFEQLKGIRERIGIPLVLMGYLNPVLQFGMQQFITNCVDCGIDGLILPDLPVEVYVDHYKPQFEAAGLAFIPLITPQTSPERIRFLDTHGSGFIYLVSGPGTTGGNKCMEEEAAYFERVKAMPLRLPKIAGFGVRTKSDIELLRQYVDGAIIGSAFVQHLEAGWSNTSIAHFVQALK